MPPISTVTKEKKFRVLVVDDFETNRQALAIQLSRLNVEIDEADNGYVAKEYVDSKSYDLILLDIFMPGMSGIELARLIRLHSPESSVPILGFTASEFEEDIDEALEAGMNGVIIKPVKRSELMSHIGQYLDI